MKRILGIGNALVDIMTLLESDYILQEFDLPKGSMQLVDWEKSERIKSAIRLFPRKWTSGGSAANTIHGLSMLGADTGFIGSIGRDDTGDFYERDMKQAGVNTLLIRRDTATGTAVALVSADGERTFATHLGAATELSASDLKSMLFEGYDMLYVEGYLITDADFVETAFRYAREKGLLISLDLASYNVVESHLHSFKRVIEKYVDILFANELEAKTFTGFEPEKALNVLSDLCDIVVLKTGADGSWVKRGGETVKISASTVACLDTTGAGDLYASGFLYGLANDFDLELCGKIGSMMAGKVIEIVGARMDKEKFASIAKEIEVLSGNYTT